ncbi:MAG TPA: prepilin-type N-terminal cleavage/methylation domain-containing protein [Candidatus Saccharimonadales bacterium]|nr:prepilin-type N-terminal cleavage/methylation domain-containing protein [Candidatus Saccharimonadales bacterium]
MYKRRPQNQSGFTIVELMIATVVLSVALLIATMTIMGVGRLYYKGQNAARTNDTARNAIEEISRQIQFSPDSPNLYAAPKISGCPNAPGETTQSFWCYETGSGKVYGYCIGNTRYSFALGTQFIDGINHGLWEDTMAGADVTNCKPLDVLHVQGDGTPKTPTGAVGGTDGKELLLPHMRVMGLEITQNTTTGAYEVTLDVAYGDDDLLNAPTVDTNHPALLPQTCKTTVGDQFCATANLTTSVTRRLE